MSLLALPYLKTPALDVRLGKETDVPAILKYLTENREFFKPFEPVKPAGFYTASFWVAQLRRSLQEYYADQSLRLFIFKPAQNEAQNRGAQNEAQVIGTVNFTQVLRGPSQSAVLGYSLAQSAQGQGHMTEALRAAIGFVFSEMKLHRVCANYMPHNDRSARVLKRLGFTIEGNAKDYLLIEGKWRDHVLTSLTNPAWRPADSS